MLVLSPLVACLALSVNPGVVTLKAEVEQISRSSGIRITVDRSLASDLVFVSPGRLQGSDLLKVVASAVHASVVDHDGTLRVERTKADLADIHKQRVINRSKWIGDHIARLDAFRAEKLGKGSLMAAYTAEQKAESDAMQRYSEHTGPYPNGLLARELLPSEKLIDDLVGRIGAKVLSEIPTGSVKIFEDVPVGGAENLPAHEDLLDRYVRDSAPLANETLPPSSEWNSRFFGLPGVRPVKLRVIIFAAPDALSAEMDGYDDRGKQVVYALSRTWLQSSDKWAPAIASEAMADPQAHWIKLSQDDEEIFKIITPDVFGDKRPELLLQPEKHEPLNLFASTALNGIAEQNPDGATVIHVSDNLWGLGALVHRDGQMCSSALEKLLTQREDYERIESSGSILWRPRDPEFEEAETADRSVLATTVNAIVNRTGNQLRTVSVGYREASAQSDPMVQRWFDYAIWLTDLRVAMLPPESVCRVLGGLSESDWQALLNGRTLALTGVEKSDIWNAVALDALKPTGRPFDNDVQKHALELFDQYNLEDIRLTLKFKSSPVARSWIKEEEKRSWLDPSILATLGPEQTVHFDNFPNQWGRSEFAILMGFGRLFRFASAVDLIADFSLPHGFHADVSCRVGYANVTEPTLFSDLSEKTQESMFLEWKRQRDDAIASLHPSVPPNSGEPSTVKP